MAFLRGDEKRKLGPRLALWAAGGLDLLFPPLCLHCAIEVDAHNSLCGDCWNRLTFLAGSQCQQCGFPFESDLGMTTLCARCLALPPAFDWARAVFRYDDGSRRLILSFKHGDRLEGAPAFSGWMTRALGDLVADIDLIAPVPLHRWRLLRRRYNQAAILGHGLACRTGRPVVADLLHRARATVSQGGLNREERHRNVQGAFAVRPCHLEKLAGRSVLLVDDVMTTGATLDACAATLKSAGAGMVAAIVLGRAVGPGTI